MLKYMRNNLKVIMWIIIGTFVGTIFVSWGMGGIQQQKNIAAKIDGKKISLTEYYEVLNRYYNFYQQVYKGNLTPEILKKANVEKMAMDQIIRDTILGKKAEEMGILVSDEEVISYFKEYDGFKTDGKFDPRKFIQISKARGVNWEQQEKQIRKEIMQSKLESIIKDAVIVSGKEVKSSREECFTNWYEDILKKSNIVVYKH